MFGSYMVQMVRSNAHKLDRPLRESVLKLYKPFKWTPCFLHGFFEKILMKNKKIPVIIEFEKDSHHKGYRQQEKKQNQASLFQHWLLQRGSHPFFFAITSISMR